jgi:hypothetical protein
MREDDSVIFRYRVKEEIDEKRYDGYDKVQLEDNRSGKTIVLKKFGTTSLYAVIFTLPSIRLNKKESQDYPNSLSYNRGENWITPSQSSVVSSPWFGSNQCPPACKAGAQDLIHMLITSNLYEVRPFPCPANCRNSGRNLSTEMLSL